MNKQSIKKRKKVCSHDRYVSEESQGKMSDYYLLRQVSICADCDEDITHLRLLRR